MNKNLICAVLSIMAISMNAGRLQQIGYLGSQVVAGSTVGYATALLCKTAANYDDNLCSTCFAGGLLSSLFIPDVIENIAIFKKYKNIEIMNNKGRMAYVVGMGIGFDRFINTYLSVETK